MCVPRFLLWSSQQYLNQDSAKQKPDFIAGE